MHEFNTKIPSDLSPGSADYVASAAKAALGAVPFAGSLLAELAGNIIPNQRIDRLVKFTQALETRISELDQLHVRGKLQDEEFTDLFEESVRQAARSTTDDRRGYLAAVLANGLSSDALSHAESKHLLRILGEINDAEVIWLRLHAVPQIDGDKEFRERHKATLKPAMARMGSSRAEFDQYALQQSYKEHLASLGLLEQTFAFDPKTRQPTLETSTGRQKVKGYRMTILGRLLLRQIGMGTGDDSAGTPHSES